MHVLDFSQRIPFLCEAGPNDVRFRLWCIPKWLSLDSNIFTYDLCGDDHDDFEIVLGDDVSVSNSEKGRAGEVDAI